MVAITYGSMADNRFQPQTQQGSDVQEADLDRPMTATLTLKGRTLQVDALGQTWSFDTQGRVPEALP